MRRVASIIALLFLTGSLLVWREAASQISISQTLAGPLVQLSALAVGPNGNRIVEIRSGSASMDFPSIPATSKNCMVVPVSPPITPALGDVAFLSSAVSFADDILIGEVVINNTPAMFLCLYNPTAGAIDPAANTVNYVYYDLTP